MNPSLEGPSYCVPMLGNECLIRLHEHSVPLKIFTIQQTSRKEIQIPKSHDGNQNIKKEMEQTTRKFHQNRKTKEKEKHLGLKKKLQKIYIIIIFHCYLKPDSNKKKGDDRID